MEQAFCPGLFCRSPPCPSSHTPLLYPGFKFVFKSLPKTCSHISPFCSGGVSRCLHIFLLFWPVHLTQTMKGRRIYLGSWFPRCWSIVGGGCGEVRSSRHGCQEAEKYNTGRKLCTILPQRQAPSDILPPAARFPRRVSSQSHRQSGFTALVLSYLLIGPWPGL